MSTERKRTGPKRQRQLVKGIPGGDCDSCVDWLLNNINKAKGRGAKVGQIARYQFAILLDACIRSLLDLALPSLEKDKALEEWAGRILAKVHVSLEAHKWKLERENPAYRDQKAKMGKTRANVLVPESEISQMVREELINAELYQFQLGILREMMMINSQNEFRPLAVNKKAVFERIKRTLTHQALIAGEQRTSAIPMDFWPDEVREGVKKEIEEWLERKMPQIAHSYANAPALLLADEVEVGEPVPITLEDDAKRRRMPKDYWPTIELPRFCAASADKWWDWLWARILKDKEVLIPGRDPSKVQTQIHDYFLALVDARENGTF
jgi:hypothetical protein